MPIKHLLHTRFTLDDDEGEVKHTVFCTRMERSVPIELCVECPQRISGPGDLQKHDAAIECHSEVRRTAKSADTRERSLRTLVGQVMQRSFVCVHGNADLERLERLVDDSSVVVIDSKSHPIGIVNRGDVLRALVEGGRDEAHEIMTPLVHAIVEDAPVSHAIAMLAIEDAGEVPVVTHEGIVVGIVRQSDIVRWLASELGYDIIEALDERASASRSRQARGT
jgi:CBS domain-containing protein